MIGTIWASRLFTTQEIAAIRSGAARIFIYGTVSYRDAFKDQWQTDFARSVKADAATLKKITLNYGLDDLKVDFETCEQNNSAT